MKKIVLILSFIFCAGIGYTFSQFVPDVTVELLTIGPGTATYSIYGHSALRIIIPEKGTDLIYNWGVFDFNTKHFVWKFAKGRLNYALDTDTFERFLQMYFLEKRWVESQKINLEPAEINRLFELINENLKPENRTYRYDFFYDDCSTRIRDLLEKAVGKNLLYPPEPAKNDITFRDKIGEYQRFYPWFNMGIDLLIGSPGDKKVSFRDKMFLPIDLQAGLSDLVINRKGKMIPLLQNPERELDFDTPQPQNSFFTSPLFIFSLILILVILYSARYRGERANNAMDIIVFSIFSLLALIMIFFNFFTDHQQTKWNLNIIWLSPFILLCLASIILKKEWYIWFRLVFFLSLIIFCIMLVFPNAFNNSFLPLLLLLVLRSSVRAGFSWNPLSVR
jgi:hypothetical protein